MPVPWTIAMSTDEGLVRRKSFVQVPPLTEKVLVAAILLLFLLLHGLAGTILQSAGARHPRRIGRRCGSTTELSHRTPSTARQRRALSPEPVQADQQVATTETITRRAHAAVLVNPWITSALSGGAWINGAAMLLV
jgi:hypothetical protein